MCTINHQDYSICSKHFDEKHHGKWNNCSQCKRKLRDYAQFKKEWFNFKIKKPRVISVKNKIMKAKTSLFKLHYHKE